MGLNTVAHHLGLGALPQLTILLLSLLIAGCGGGSGGDSGGSGAAPTIDISFPLPNSNLAGETDRITLRGRSVTSDGARLVSVQINNRTFLTTTLKPPSDLPDGDSPEVQFDPADPSRWFAQIALLDQTNDVLIEASDDRGRITEMTIALQNVPTFSKPQDVAKDPTKNRVLLVDSSLAVLLAVDLDNGRRSLISGLSTGTGDAFVTPGGLTIDATNNRALVVDSALDALLEVDLDSGDRRVISDNNIPKQDPNESETRIDFPTHLVLTAGDLALVLDKNRDALLEVNLNSGDRRVISDQNTGAGQSIGAGPPFSFPEYLAFVDNGSALVVDGGLAALLEVDLSTGNRTSISGLGVGDGPQFNFPLAVALDEGSALVVDDGLDSLLEVDLDSGNRRVISGPDQGSGPPFENPEGITLDAAGNRALVVDVDIPALLEVDLSSGNRRIITDSDTITTTGPTFLKIHGVALDTANNRLLVVDGEFGPNSLLEVDLDTGNRQTISDTDTGAGTPFMFLEDVAVDTDNNQVLVLDIQLDALLAVDLTTGDRRVISDADTGTGLGFNRPLDMELDTGNNRALVVDPALAVLMEVDLDSGNRRIISDEGRGTGPLLAFPMGVVLAANNHALVVDRTLNALLDIDLSSGDRNVISGGEDENIVGNGDNFLRIAGGLVLDATNNRAIVADGGRGGRKALWTVDLNTGNREILSETGEGFGSSFNFPQNLALDAANDRVFLADQISNALLVVDLISHDRAIFSQ
ncbi:MAG: hypothetical protein GY807_12065 [Gammaproteobacteria bacterium]|nr:hypothetical protein [Gammaproteobacteria bacterium]